MRYCQIWTVSHRLGSDWSKTMSRDTFRLIRCCVILRLSYYSEVSAKLSGWAVKDSANSPTAKRNSWSGSKQSSLVPSSAVQPPVQAVEAWKAEKLKYLAVFQRKYESFKLTRGKRSTIEGKTIDVKKSGLEFSPRFHRFLRGSILKFLIRVLHFLFFLGFFATYMVNDLHIYLFLGKVPTSTVL